MPTIINKLPFKLYKKPDEFSTIYPLGSDGRPTGKVYVEDGITQIHHDVTMEDTNITSVSLPKTLQRFDDYQFKNCVNLESVTFREYNPSFRYSISSECFSGCTSLKHVDIPPVVSTISSNAFYKTNIESFDFTNIDYLGSGSFMYTKLKTINITDKVDSYGMNVSVFRYCEELETVYSNSIYLVDDQYVFANCTNLKNIEIPEGTIHLGSWVFSNCISLKTLHLPTSLTYIGGGALEKSGIESINLENITKFGSNVFMGSAIKNATIPGTCTIDTDIFRDCLQLESVTFGEGITTIPYRTCMGSTVSEVNLPSTLTTIKKQAFDHCINLKSIVIPDGVTTLEEQCFWYSGLVSIDLPDSITTIGNNVFGYCDSLKSFRFPSSMTSLSYNIFYNCLSLETIEITNPNFTFTHYNGFYYCKALKRVIVPEGFCKSLYISSNSSSSHSQLLEVEGMVNMFNNLADLTGSTAQTITIGANNKAKLSAEQIAIATSKNWIIN